MIKIDHNLLKTISRQAKQSPRLRMNYNFHSGSEDTLQRMLNAMEPGTYICPHKHENPDKREVFFALKGTICLVEFDDKGNIRDHTIIKPDGDCPGVEIPERTYHTVISLEPGSVAYELKDGPYNPTEDKNFATWAPPEGSPEATYYLTKLISTLNLPIS
ncbi:MAG: WbuC family cupin fold metalloprotein [Lentimicrobium sp.]|jgi:cupin fold WbuC family metalloprotein|nr:WbuC family cupin fold metalloprotein [Lentimicrobium sp.]